jgi:hypothetical protein
MNESIEQGNELHYEALAVVEAFVKSGGKIITEFKTKHKLPKGTINKKSQAKPGDKHETNINRFKGVMKKYGQLTSVEVCMYTGMAKPEMFRCARKAENDGIITRVTGRGVGGVTVFNLVC